MKNAKRLLSILLTLAMLLGMVPAQALEEAAADSVPICGLTEHVHDEACYERTLTCGQEEHIHDGDCMKIELVCETEETEAHVHTEDCFDTVSEEDPETGETAEHAHDEDCYADTLVCGLPEHTHTEECYAPAEAASLPETEVPAEAEAREKRIQESGLEIALAEPDWDDPFVEGYDISAVLTVPGAWDGYDWQVYAGPYAEGFIEDFDEDEDEPWVSGALLGLDELVLDGKLYLPKELLYTYAFRCVVEKDGELFATAPFAENEDALVMPQYNVNLLAAEFQPASGI